MKKKWEKIKSLIFKVIITINSHHTGAYAAQAAYFFVLSLIPIFLLLLTMVRFTPITMSEVMTAVLKVFPESVAPMIRSIVSQVYFQSGTIVPVTIVVALWSAGKGVLSVTSGLNSICENMETRNYFYLRIRASFYTVIFLLAIVSSLVLSVFGNRISVMIYEHIPFLSKVVEFIIRIRTFVTFVVLTVFWDLVYRFLPNRRNMAKTTLRKQLPGAVFTACGWLLLSFFFSVYLDVFKGFTSMYGSLTTIILIMLWLYGCMYIILLGGEINALLEKFLQKRAGNLKKKKEKETLAQNNKKKKNKKAKKKTPPKPTSVSVRNGDNLDRIARRQGTTVEALKKANNLSGDNPVIQPGQKLKLPKDKKASKADKKEEKSSKKSSKKGKKKRR